ncbi:MAG: cupin [Proteobacteria bacterium]|nr:cupin [Pseudomonadota bacterium]
MSDELRDFLLLADALEPVEPAEGLKSRLLASALSPQDRWAPFGDRIADLFDVAAATAREYLSRIADPAHWEAAIAEGIALVHLDGGPRVAHADVGFTRAAAGTSFPVHTHDGGETTLVLQGRYRDSDGSVVGPGTLVTMAPGSTHSFEVLSGDDLIFAVVVDGVRFHDPAIIAPD